MKYLFIGALLAWSSAANGEDEKPKYTNIEQGQAAPFTGRLFNNAAVSKIIVDYQFNDIECKLRVDFEIGQIKISEQYKYNLLYAKSEADNEKYLEIINIRERHIKSLEKYVRPSNAHWWTLAGFVAGSTTAVGIMYIVAPAFR
jgi:hypothetical protein